MSKYPPSVIIAGYLLQAGIYHDDKQRRLGLAGKIADTHKPFDQYTLERLLALARSQGDGGKVGGLSQYDAVKGWLENHEWINLDKRLRAEADERRKKLDEQHASNTESSIQKVSADNPYGWAKPELMKRDDHDIPGAWNAYRQCYNMTMDERIANSNKDYRYRGCSRYEMMPEEAQVARKGWRPGNTIDPDQLTWKPTAGYDALEVAKAQSKDYGVPVTERKVYGE